ncbi:MAG: phosphoglycerate kinase [Patescibacteria group bacterium]
MVGTQFKKKTVKDVELKGKRVLLRADYNVPIKDNRVVDDYRIRQSLPTIEYILKQKPASLIIISHLGRPRTFYGRSHNLIADYSHPEKERGKPEGKPNPDFSLLPVVKRLSQLLDRQVGFGLDCIGKQAQTAAAGVKPGGVTLLENLRFHTGEEENDPAFAKKIVEASRTEVFVQDGFGVVHRAHASTDAITKFLPSVAGLLLEKEVSIIGEAMNQPKRPLVAIIGGAKISDKIEVLGKFIEVADAVAVGGALANNFLAAEGLKVGKSLIEKELMHETEAILRRARAEEKKRDFNFFLPVDAVVCRSMDGRLSTRLVDLTSNVLADIEAYPKKPPTTALVVAADELILDIGPISAAAVAGAVKMAKTVIWGGTLGVTETKGIAGAQAPFAHGTRTVVEAMIGSSNNHKNKPFSIVGGGDTVAYVESENLVEDFNHVSTGGSASLDLMAGKPLPGIETLEDK